MRELTPSELCEVSGGMRGSPFRPPTGNGNFPSISRHPEHQHLELRPPPQHANPVGAKAGCLVMGAGAAAMALPLTPAGQATAFGLTASLCDTMFKN